MTTQRAPEMKIDKPANQPINDGDAKPKHKSTLVEKLAWGAGGMTESLQNSIWTLSFPIYSIALGVSPALIGIAKALPLVVDAFTDPIMGEISDRRPG